MCSSRSQCVHLLTIDKAEPAADSTASLGLGHAQLIQIGSIHCGCRIILLFGDGQFLRAGLVGIASVHDSGVALRHLLLAPQMLLIPRLVQSLVREVLSNALEAVRVVLVLCC